MATLMFECPTNGTEVSTGVEVDAASFNSLSQQATYLQCPHCPAPHLLGDVRAWLSDEVDKSPEQHPMRLAG